MKNRERRFIQCGRSEKRKIKFSLPRAHFSVETQSLALNRGQKVRILRQCWSKCGPTHPQSLAMWAEKLLESWEIFSWEPGSSIGWHWGFSLSLLPEGDSWGKFQFLGVHCFNNLTAKGRGTSVSPWITFASTKMVLRGLNHTHTLPCAWWTLVTSWQGR